MIFVWGSRLSFPKSGYGADYCPFCRDLRQFEVREVRQVRHLYYIPVGRGKLIGHRLQCMDCGAAVWVDESLEHSLAPLPSPTIADSVAATNPELPSQLSERLALEEGIKSGRAATEPNLREFLLLEPFEALSPELEREVSRTHFDLPSLLACLAAVALPVLSLVVLVGLADRLAGEDGEVIAATGAVIGACLAGIFLVRWQFRRSRRSWIESHLVPHLNRALRPLGPTMEEIEGILAAYRAGGLTFAKYLRPGAFSAAVQPDDGAVVEAVVESASPLRPK